MSNKEEMIKKINSTLRYAILDQPNVVRPILGNIRAQIAHLFTTDEVNSLQRIYITGCGDSFFASLAAELAFLKFSGIDTSPVEPLNLSRYISHYAPKNSLLISISNSGKVSRTIEVTRRCSQKMATLAITDAPQSQLAQAASKILSPEIPPLPSGGAGTRSYIASLLALYALALHLGKLRGNITTAEYEAAWQQLERSEEYIRVTLEVCQTISRAYISQLNRNLVFIVGGGPNYGTAQYGAAKFLEALSVDGVAVELEEWAHLQFHTTFENTPYFLIAPPGASYDRAIEQAQGIKQSGGHLAIVTSSEDSQVSALGDFIFPIHSPAEEAFTPLVYCIPFQLLAVDLADHRNQSMIMRLDEQRKQINFQQIFHSKILI